MKKKTKLSEAPPGIKIKPLKELIILFSNYCLNQQVMSHQQIEGCADIYLFYKKYKCYVKKTSSMYSVPQASTTAFLLLFCILNYS